MKGSRGPGTGQVRTPSCADALPAIRERSLGASTEHSSWLTSSPGKPRQLIQQPDAPAQSSEGLADSDKSRLAKKSVKIC
jgi:hypothetical protein